VTRLKYFTVAALIAATAFPARLLAHTHLKSSSPANGAVVTLPPKELRFTFNESPELGFTSVELTGPGGKTIALGAAARSGETSLVIPVLGQLNAGKYRVRWKTAGKDGHPAIGEFGFAIAETANTSALPSTPAVMPPMTAHHDSVSFPEGREFTVESPGYVAIRWLQFTALLSLVGAFAFRYIVLGFLRRKQAYGQLIEAAEERAGVLARRLAVVLFVLAMIRLAAQSYVMHGVNQTMLGAMRPMLFHTTWGAGWLIQFIASFVIATALRRAGRGWAIGAIGAIGLAFTPALSGHAASAPNLSWLAVLADGIHVLSAGGWLGSLLVVLVVGIPSAMQLEEEKRGSAVADIVNAFSPTGLSFAAVLVVTGVFAAWLHIGSIRGLWEAGYGRILIVKLAIISGVVATGAYNWLRVRPALGDSQGTVRIRRSATIEIGVGLLVLLVTAILVATPTSMDLQP
jgi:copper transport protein